MRLPIVLLLLLLCITNALNAQEKYKRPTVHTTSTPSDSPGQTPMVTDVSIPEGLKNTVCCCFFVTPPPPSAPETHVIVRRNSLVSVDTLLYVVDGILTPEKDLARFTSNDIKSIEMVRQDDAVAAFGSRGANGVVIITTQSRRQWKQAHLKF